MVRHGTAWDRAGWELLLCSLAVPEAAAGRSTPQKPPQLSTQHQTAPSKPSIRKKKVVPPNGEGQWVYSSAMPTDSFTKHPHPLRQASSRLLSTGKSRAGGCRGLVWLGAELRAGWMGADTSPQAPRGAAAAVHWQGTACSCLLAPFTYFISLA